MTRLKDRQTLVHDTAQARAAGARLASACALAGVDVFGLARNRRLEAALVDQFAEGH